MRRPLAPIIRLLPLLVLLSHLASAQTRPGWFPIDTITAGEGADRNPAIAENCWMAMWAPQEIWVIFERWTKTESRIEGRRLNAGSRAWDTTGHLIAAAPLEEAQIRPSLGEFDRHGYPTLRIAAWQQKHAGSWRVMISTAIDSAVTWSAPEPVSPGPGNQTTPIVRRCGGPIVAWSEGNLIRGVVITEGGTWGVPDTLAVGADSTLEFDIISSGGWGRHGIIWRSTGTDVQSQLCYRILNDDPFDPTPVDTVDLPFDVSAPRLFVDMYPFPSLLCNVGPPGGRDILYYRGEQYGWDLIASDLESDEWNARAFQPPMITKRNGGMSWWYIAAGGYERIVPGDTALVFFRVTERDTVRSAGFNRNLRIGSAMFNAPTGVYAVWESNRTGTSHLYGRFLQVPLGGVEVDPPHPASVVLLPNYPNPFNPRTTIRFEIPTAAHVRLAVFNTLGQVVATLVDGERSAGAHAVEFDGVGLASGPYICRLQAGEYVGSRRMVLLR